MWNIQSRFMNDLVSEEHEIKVERSGPPPAFSRAIATAAALDVEAERKEFARTERGFDHARAVEVGRSGRCAREYERLGFKPLADRDHAAIGSDATAKCVRGGLQVLGARLDIRARGDAGAVEKRFLQAEVKARPGTERVLVKNKNTPGGGRALER